MSQVKLSGKALVIQIDSKHIRIAQTVLGTASPQLFAQTVVDTPNGAVDDGSLLNIDAVKFALSDALQRAGLARIRQCVFSLCTSRVITEEVTAPKVSGSRLDALLQANLDMYFPADVRDYLIAYEPSGDAPEKGASEQRLRLWATPRGVVMPYYNVANSLGLSVAAIEWFGHSLVNSVGASFGEAAEKKQKKPRRSGKDEASSSDQDLSAVQADSAESVLYIDAEPEFLLMTFVKNGRVVLQRLLRQDDSAFSEAQIVLDYYRSTDSGRYVSVRGCLVGSMRDLSELSEQLQHELEIPIQIDGDGRMPDWYLCTGAAMARVDFGSASFNRVSRPSDQVHQLWQYALVLAGGLAVAAAVMAIVANRLTWTSRISAEQSRQEMLMLQMQQENARYAEVKQQQELYDEAYQAYAIDYLNYNRAYDNLYGPTGDKALLENAVRTYNGNLILMLTELEQVLPAGTSTLTIGIGEEGMGLEFSCTGKEETAKLIQELRNLRYASLEQVTTLALNRRLQTGYGILPSLQAMLAAEQAAAEAQRQAELEAQQQQAAAAAAQGQDLNGKLENPSQDEAIDESKDLIEAYLGNSAETPPKNGSAASVEDYSFEERQAAVYKLIAEDDEGWDCFLQAMLDESGSQDAAYIQQVGDKARSLLSGGSSSLSSSEKNDLVDIGLSVGSVKSAVKNGDKDALDSQLSPYRHTLAKVMAIDEEMLLYTEDLFAGNAMLEAKYESYLADQRQSGTEPTVPTDPGTPENLYPEYSEDEQGRALRWLIAGDDEGWDCFLQAMADQGSSNTRFLSALVNEIVTQFQTSPTLTTQERAELLNLAMSTDRLKSAVTSGNKSELDSILSPYRDVLSKVMTANNDILNSSQQLIAGDDLLQAKYESYLAAGLIEEPAPSRPTTPTTPGSDITVDPPSNDPTPTPDDDSIDENELKELLKELGLLDESGKPVSGGSSGSGGGSGGSTLSPYTPSTHVGMDEEDRIYFAALLRYKEELIMDEYKSKVKAVEAPEKLPVLEQYTAGGESR